MKLLIHFQNSMVELLKFENARHYNGCNYLSMVGLMLIHVSKRGTLAIQNSDSVKLYFLCISVNSWRENTILYADKIYYLIWSFPWQVSRHISPCIDWAVKQECYSSLISLLIFFINNLYEIIDKKMHIETVSADGRSAQPARLGYHPIWWQWHGNTKSLSKVLFSDV